MEFGCARYNEAGIDWLFRVVKEMFQNSLSIRCGGSAALGLCRGASGSNTVYLELKLQPYDYAAASVILEEAGGRKAAQLMEEHLRHGRRAKMPLKN